VTRFSAPHLCAVLVVFAALTSVSRVQADEPRARRLTYDPDRREWKEIPPPMPGTAEGDLYAIQMDIEGEKFGRALKGLKGFEKAYGTEHALYPEAMIARAEALLGRREYEQAHAVLREFLDRYPGLALTSEALRLEFIIAETFFTGTKRKFLGMRLLSGDDIAGSILDEISMSYPADPLAPLAIKAKADQYFKTGEHALAEMEYARLLRDHPNHRYHRVALRRSAEAALASFRGLEYDEAALIEAEERFNEYRLQYPTAADREEIDLIVRGIGESRAAKDYSVGAFYERTGHVATAVYYYRLVRREWPDTVAAARATTRLVSLGVLEAVELPAGVEEDAPTGGDDGQGGQGKP
jgi:outer membrane protein assembly factor BamD (BamD/ComL family)